MTAARGVAAYTILASSPDLRGRWACVLLLLQLVLRYSAQFRQDARRLFDSERGYNADFSKTCNELIDKYLANFQEEVREAVTWPFPAVGWS